jgi:hypothetical protein
MPRSMTGSGGWTLTPSLRTQISSLRTSLPNLLPTGQTRSWWIGSSPRIGMCPCQWQWIRLPFHTLSPLTQPPSFELNAGSFLTRATPRTAKFVDAVIDYHNTNATQEHQLSEQDCMRDIMFKQKRFTENYVFIPQYKLNAFPQEIKCFDKYKKGWAPGTFMVRNKL